MPESTKLRKSRRKEEKMRIVMMNHLTLVCSIILLFFVNAWYSFLTFS